MDTRIALTGQPVDFAGSISNGLQAGQMQAQAQRQNALAALYQQQGPQMMAGNPQALNALAQMDPTAAMGMQSQQLGMQQTQQSMGFDAEKMQMVRDQAKQAMADRASAMTAAQAKAESDKLGSVLQGAMAAPDEATYNAWLAQNGIDPSTHPFATRDLSAAAVMGAKEVLDIRAKQAETAAGPDWTTAAPDVLAQHPGAVAGQYNRKTGEFKADAQPSGGISIDAKTGQVTIGGPAKATAASDAFLGPQSMIDSIDGVLNDPNLDKSTGLFSYGQSIRGTPQFDFGQKVAQLQGKTFMQAYQSLKGAGAITETEGAKAEAAIARLDSGQSPAAFRQALGDLRDVLTEVQKRQAQSTSSQASGNVDFTKMDLPALTSVDVGTLTPDQKTALSARLKELGF